MSALENITSVCFKSESSDYYMFVSDKLTLEGIKEDLMNQWWIETEMVHIVSSYSDWPDAEIQEIVEEIQEEFM